MSVSPTPVSWEVLSTIPAVMLVSSLTEQKTKRRPGRERQLRQENTTEGFGSSLTAEALEQWYEATEFVSAQNAQVVKGVLYEACDNEQVGVTARSMKIDDGDGPQAGPPSSQWEAEAPVEAEPSERSDASIN